MKLVVSWCQWRQLVMDQAWGLTPIDNPRLAELCLMHHYCIKGRKIAKKFVKIYKYAVNAVYGDFFWQRKPGQKI